MITEKINSDKADVSGLVLKGAAVLVACEESQTVTKALRQIGIEAWSNDIQECSGGHSEWHLKMDVFEAIGLRKWDMMIAHPPCTYISNMSNCRIKEPGRIELRKAGMEFFMKIINAPIEMIAVENPRGLPEREYRRADQIIQPYHFGHPFSKATCLWLKNLPPLLPTEIMEPERKWDGKRWRTWIDFHGSHNAKSRSKTFEGIANAMATQWGLGVLAAAPFKTCR